MSCPSMPLILLEMAIRDQILDFPLKSNLVQLTKISGISVSIM